MSTPLREMSAHGVQSAYYSNLPGPSQTTWFLCMCGAEISGQTSSWEDTGREMDLHLQKTIRDERQTPLPGLANK